jgi:glutamate synthase (NADPH/NADH) large chain
MAQGAKPGEGGQLPGDKVDAWIGKPVTQLRELV